MILGEEQGINKLTLNQVFFFLGFMTPCLCSCMTGDYVATVIHADLSVLNVWII